MRAVFLVALIAVAGCGGGSKHINSTTNVAFLYVVGQGSNTIQGFHIQASGELSATSQPSFATNARPVAMALHPTTNFVYVANLTANTVSGYNVDHTSGFLTPVGTALAPVPTGPSPIAVGVNSGGQFLFVLNQGDASISVYSIDPTRGILTQVGSAVPTGLTNTPQSMVVSPTASFLYVVSGTAPSTISVFSISGNGALAAAPGSFTGASTSNISRMTIDPKGQFLYAADSANNNVVSLSISASGALSPVAGSPFTAGKQPFAVAVDATNTFVYVSNSGSNDVSAFKTSAGVLTPITGSPFPTQGSGTVSATQPGFLIVDATNTFVYVSNVATKAVAAFAINSADGTLVAVNNSPFGQIIAPSWLVSTK